MKKVLFFILAMSFLVGCDAQTITSFVVLRDVPVNPTFTIIPFNYYHAQIAYANRAEEALIKSGVRTVSPPNLKEITKKKSLAANKEGILGNILSSKKTAAAVTIESYFEYGDVSADYILRTDALSKRVKIIKKETREVLASFIINENVLVASKIERDYGFNKVIHDSLESLGIKVRGLPEPPKPITEPKTKTGNDY